jgi:predicted nucleotidyltransferase
VENHHKESIERFLDRYKHDSTILAILLGGSIAHGFAKPDSDVDVTIIVEEAEYQKRKSENKLAFSLWDICTYTGGYIDCKVVNLEFIKDIIDKGSDPARYAYKDNMILFSKIDNLAELLEDVVKFPVRDKDNRRDRFASQLLAWKWYYSEAIKKQNQYLVYLSIQKIILFSCRIILNENNMLFPYHKWLLNETRMAKRKPDNFDQAIERIMEQHSLELVNQFCSQVLRSVGLEEKSLDWPNWFLVDSELNWVEHAPPIDDL